MAQRIVVGVDGSPSSRAALAWAADQAALSGATLEVTIVWDDNLPWMPNLGRESWDPVENARIGVTRVVDEVLGPEPGVPLSIVALVGRPATSLIETAHGAELLVVGCRGHRRLVGGLLGSVSMQCITHASCPVLVMHQATANRDASRTPPACSAA